jgi:hypothetical protein
MRGRALEGEVSGVFWRPDGRGLRVARQYGRDPRGTETGGLPCDELYEVTLLAGPRARKPHIY